MGVISFALVGNLRLIIYTAAKENAHLTIAANQINTFAIHTPTGVISFALMGN